MVVVVAVEEEKELGSERKRIRCRRMGERSGRSAGGGRVDAKAVARQAKREGRRACAEGVLMCCFMVVRACRVDLNEGVRVVVEV